MCSAILTATAVAAVYATTGPAIVCLLIEPLSLLLFPGLVVALGAAGAHDFSPNSVIYAAFAWYVIFFYLIFTWRYRRRARLILGSDL